MVNSPQSFYEEMETHYDEPYTLPFILYKAVGFLGVLAITGVTVFFSVSQATLQISLLVILLCLLLLSLVAYDLWCQHWKWRHWGLKLNADKGAAELHRPGNGRSLFPYVRNQEVQYMPLLGAQVTRNDQSTLEQWFFRRSSTISLDGDAQSDVDWQNIRYVRDANRIKNIILAYNQRERALEHAQSDHLASIARSNELIVQQNERVIEQLDELLNLLRPTLLVLNGQGAHTAEMPTVPDEDDDDSST